ncbi:Imm44 family immunity protein [Oceanivirga salmonicida]|uniref:Imm44 family immunity protein n=2 Tax=Oceanivirga salmonicida TaxID=1769291 RepID=UPI00082F2586|nr:Imm44 family immunity protein [Oceanivirga salmonicida]
MKLWMSSEYSVGIGDKLRLARNYVEKVINEKINKKKYMLEEYLEGWDCISIIMNMKNHEYIERTIYSKKKKDMDFRLQIDYEEFDNTDDLGRQRLIYEMLDRSLDILLEKKKLPLDAIEELRADVKEVAKEQGWI